MDEKATQDARLDYLVEEFKADSVQYKDLKMSKGYRRKTSNPAVTYEHPNASKDE